MMMGAKRLMQLSNLNYSSGEKIKRLEQKKTNRHIARFFQGQLGNVPLMMVAYRLMQQ